MFIYGLGHNIIYYMGDEPSLSSRWGPCLKSRWRGFDSRHLPLYFYIWRGLYYFFHIRFG